MEHPTLGENPRPHIIPEANGKAQSTCVNTSEKPNKILKNAPHLYQFWGHKWSLSERGFSRIMGIKFRLEYLNTSEKKEKPTLTRSLALRLVHPYSRQHYSQHPKVEATQVSIDEWMDTQCCMYIMKYYSSFKKEGNDVWLNHEDIMLREISQSQKDKCCRLPWSEIISVVKFRDRKQKDACWGWREMATGR